MQERLSKFLFKYRLTPHSTTGVAPSEMLMGRKLRSRLDLMFPDLSEKVQRRQEKQKKNHDNSQPLREFKVQDTVYVENVSASQPLPKWLPGTVAEIVGSRSYRVELLDGRGTVRRHVDSISGHGHLQFRKPLLESRSQTLWDQTYLHPLLLAPDQWQK